MKAAIIVVVLGLAGFLVWQKLFSPTARIERAYLTCMKEAEVAGDRRKSDLAAKAPTAKMNDPAGAVTNAMTQGTGQAMQAMVQSLSGAMCGALRASCRSNFNGGACQGALARYK
ncbi:MAG: hypothetical protein ABI886_08315 [Betaproteobacteria bacterium]